MASNILLDGLPYSVNVAGKEYPINTGFRTSISFELLMQDLFLTDREKLLQALELYYPQIPYDLPAAIDAIVWFYSMGDPPKEKKKIEADDEEEEDEEEEEGLLRSDNRSFSYEYDAPYIYAAFVEQYGIDLTAMREEDLHWWKFRSLFQGLSQDTQLMKIIGYRNTKITDKMSKEQKDYYRRMKKMFALPLSEQEQMQQDAILDALINGEDVSHLL